jgi:hypothetical protein
MWRMNQKGYNFDCQLLNLKNYNIYEWDLCSCNDEQKGKLKLTRRGKSKKKSICKIYPLKI